MVRVFVALELAPQVRDALAGSQQTLRSCGARLSFVKPDSIHITVKFLGEVDEKKLPAVKDALKGITCTPFHLRATSITADNLSRPRTVWSAIEDGGRSAALFNKVEDALEPLGFPRETRKFTPHATIARVKRPDPSLLPAIGTLKAFSAGESLISGFTLKKSTLTPQGPIYEDLLEVSW